VFVVAFAVVTAMLLLATCRPSQVELVQNPDSEVALVDGGATASAGAIEVSPTAPPTEPAVAPTDEPTVTPVPTATPVPEPTAVLMASEGLFDQHAARSDLAGGLIAPIDCAVVVAPEIAESLATPDAGAQLPTVFPCADGPAELGVKAAADGRVAMVVRTEEGQLTPPPATYEEWSWTRGLSLGNYVVIDHGPLVPWRNLMTLYAGLSTIPPDLLLGQTVESGQIIGQLNGDAALQYEIWPQGQPLMVVPSEPVEREATPADLAGKIALNSVPPIEPSCRFPAREPSSLPNAARPYRNGTHRGVDFVCNQRGLDAYAFAEGQVAMVVRDYEDATPPNRNALLRSGVDLGDTPHWTLMMLYGNFVVIDHGDLPDIGRSYTIYAHLEEVDPAVVLGQPIRMGARVGEVGNRGTNDAASGTTAQNPRSLHLHWELHTEGQYLGAGLTAEESETAYRLLLCDDQTLLEGC